MLKLKIVTISIIFLSFITWSSNNKPSLVLAKTYSMDKSIDLDKYLISEKFDGVRGYWDGKVLKTRGGKLIQAPKYFLDKLPNISLDGELWLGYNKFPEVSGLIRSQKPSDPRWMSIKYLIFESPSLEGDFKTRIEKLKNIVKTSKDQQIQVIEQLTISNKNELNELLDQVLKRGGEGLMLHLKSADYLVGRSDVLLKLKPYQDADAILIGYTKGKGKYRGKIGTFIVKNNSGDIFKIASGISDNMRNNPPKIGTKVTYKYYGKTKNDIPRHPIFLRIRED